MFGVRLVILHEYDPVEPVPAEQLCVYVPDVVPHSSSRVGSSFPVVSIVAFAVAVVDVIDDVEFVVVVGGYDYAGGAGGGLTGLRNAGDGGGGYGATQSAGGTGGGSSPKGGDGSLGQGGSSTYYGGGGGGGYYGGGGSGSVSGYGNGGGGGSSYIGGVTNGSTSAGSGSDAGNNSDEEYVAGIGSGGSGGTNGDAVDGGNGRVVISYSATSDSITIQNPDTSKISDAVTDGYMSVDNGSIDNTDQVSTQVNVTFAQNGKEALFPSGTTITEQTNQNFNFENFTLEQQDVQSEQTESIKAFRLGIPGEKLTFSQDITVTINLGAAYNNQELDILYQEEGETTWNTQGTCTVSNGDCTFTTDHATIYTINGVLQSTGNAPLDINVEVQSTLSLDCYDAAGSSGDYDVSIGTAANPGLVTAGIPAVGESTCTTTTNDDQGYYLTVVDDNGAGTATLTHGSYEIADLTQYTFATPNTQNWSAPTTKGLGFSVISFPDTNLTNNQFTGYWTTAGSLCEEGTTADNADYSGIPDTPQAIAAVTQYESSSTTTNICYKVDVPSSQPSGQYTGSVTYTATSDASSYVQ